MNDLITLDMRTVPGTVASGDAHAIRTQAPLPPPPKGFGPAPGKPQRWTADLSLGTAHTLPEGIRLLQYEIVAPIGEGGFGIVYLAWDHAQERHVAIKEYLPAILASRACVSPAVVVKSQRHADDFRVGMRSFANEARMLARFDHPSLVKVLHFWECNGTAYMAMPYYAGPTLARALADRGEPPDEARLLGWLCPLVDALGTMHAMSCFHRDIAPDNILLTDDGPVLLDFGSARRVIEGMRKAPTAVLKPGFAPIEQYAEVPSMKQGAWTDLYALAGVVYMAIAGKAPTPSIDRLMDDRLRPLSDIAKGRYSPHFLAAIDAALSVQPADRPQTAAEFWALLSGDAAEDQADEEEAQARRVAEATALRPQPIASPPPSRRRSVPPMAVWGGAAALLALGIGAYLHPGMPERVAPAPAARAVVAPAPAAPAPIATPPVATGPVATAPVATAPVATAPAAVAAPRVAPAAEPVPSGPSLPWLGKTTVEPEPQPAPKPALAAVPRPAPAPAPAPVPARAVPEPARKSIAQAPAETARPARSPTRQAAPRPPEPAPAIAEAPIPSPAPTPAPTPSQCTEILQRASLGPITPGEAALLKKGCE
jgi:serine/threonine protein kinase